MRHPLVGALGGEDRSKFQVIAEFPVVVDVSRTSDDKPFDGIKV
jgi:hypothetical protein